MLPAARISDMISSPGTSGVPTPIVPPGATTVFIAGLPAARMGDTCVSDAIVKGSTTVLIGGLPAARIGDLTGTGGAILPPGAVTVLIGG